MKGHKRIAEILQKEYGVEDLTKYEDITYKIERFTDKVSRVTIRSNKNIFSPVYCRAYIDENSYPMPTHEITRPPQSWCYVEERSRP